MFILKGSARKPSTIEGGFEGLDIASLFFGICFYFLMFFDFKRIIDNQNHTQNVCINIQEASYSYRILKDVVREVIKNLLKFMMNPLLDEVFWVIIWVF